ncbi:hypothetical protein QCA50_008471 [Cerrena zonata]|uniref:F-box domain-containing protein n=1 Tax=Cerrena zonata TaxID=2478898 RepID=A0AAW0G462_9APHY
MLFSTISRLLPNETMDYIIDQLSDDEQTLSVCSLVCKSWVARCRVHLLETVNWQDSLKKDSKTYAFEDLVEQLKRVPDRNSYVKHLSLRGAPCLPDDSRPEVKQRPWLCEVTMRRILSQLPKLKTLTLLCVRLGDGRTDAYSHSSPISELTRFKLDRLALDRVGDPEDDFKPIYRLLDLFECIGELSVSTLRWDCEKGDDDVSVQRGLSHCSPLPSLRISCLAVTSQYPIQPVLDYIKPITESVKTLQCTFNCWDDIAAACVFAFDIGSRLEALTFRLNEFMNEEPGTDSNDSDDDEAFELNWYDLFPECSVLRKIEVVASFRDAEEPRTFASDIPSLLWHALLIFWYCPPTIDHVALKLECYHVSPESVLQCMHWETFRKVLQEWKGLRRLTIEISRLQTFETVDNNIKALLEKKLKVMNDGRLEIIISNPELRCQLED